MEFTALRLVRRDGVAAPKLTSMVKLRLIRHGIVAMGIFPGMASMCSINDCGRRLQPLNTIVTMNFGCNHGFRSVSLRR